MTRFWKPAFLIFVCLVASATLVSCSGGPASIPEDDHGSPEEYLERFIGNSGAGLPALAVSVIKDGTVVYRDILGTHRASDIAPAEAGDPFHIGSNTKAMTAMLAAVFVDRGLISWTSTIRSVLGEVPRMQADYADVTLAELLSHSGGLPASLPLTVWNTYFPWYSEHGADRAAMVEDILAQPPQKPAGQAFIYSNSGYVVAGMMLERVGGAHWEELMRRELFLPLGMATAGFGPPARNDGPLQGTAPWGHSPHPVDPMSIAGDNPQALGPAGTVHASLADLEAYVRCYLQGGVADSGIRIISSDSLEELLRPRLANYALGWGVGQTNSGKRLVTHDGSNTMFFCSITILPDEGHAIIVMTNRGDGRTSAMVERITRFLGQQFLGETMGH
ncbi:MAG: serine hydrolase domain-containing protein [Spirochaetota bacterium]